MLRVCVKPGSQASLCGCSVYIHQRECVTGLIMDTADTYTALGQTVVALDSDWRSDCDLSGRGRDSGSWKRVNFKERLLVKGSP